MNLSAKKQKKRFVLTMRNQKGQVGIFVALIFQVIFVFFAMLVNVGLVVHHKINLQQSTDLAAYYGAMKQAEIMNVMAHVNYQIRQAWKLMAWRYRVLGTFGIENNTNAANGAKIEFPVVVNNGRPVYNPASRSFACPNIAGGNVDVNGLTVTDIPFMCVGHKGFADWISAQSKDETFCKIECNGISRMNAFTITKVPTVNGSAIFGNTTGASVNTVIDKVNETLKNTCDKLGPTSTLLLSLFYGNYIKDTQNRKSFINMLNKNLGLSENQMHDIEGNSVFAGVKKTLENNLTEANLTSMSSNSNSIAALNGAKGFTESMMREINFQRLMFHMVECNSKENYNTRLKALYDTAGLLDSEIKAQLSEGMGSDQASEIENIFNQNSENTNTIGYEKNPWIHVYYGVKATAQPKIPFLPLAKIKLNAVSFAKPFGGTIGPWYFTKWDSATEDNKGRADWENRTDINLPRRTLSGLPQKPSLRDARDFLFNYSTYVGDRFSNDAPNRPTDPKAGLANTDIVAFYHLLLNYKYGDRKYDSPSSSNKIDEPTKGTNVKPQRWPLYANWFHLASDVRDPKWDPLAVDRLDGENNPKNSYIRDIEISVVSPNQFDTTYYSIEPDFTANYADKLKPEVISKIAGATNTPSPYPVIPLDYGNRGAANNIEGIPAIFNVRNQMQVTHDIFKKAANDIARLNGSAAEPIRFALDVLATKQSSLLTGWTFLNLSTTGYSAFPGADSTGGKYTMLFGTCDTDPNMNPWIEDFKAPYEIDSKMPPVPGNCVTGGRTGYSVKLISSELLRPGKKFDNLGGPGTSGQIKNPVPESFLRFTE